jgi:hypothetical protein
MNPDEYKKRIEALGFPSGASWARFVGIRRETHFRHIKGDIAPIPDVYLKIVEWLETGDLRNPNE